MEVDLFMAETISLEEALTSWILGGYEYSVITREKIAEQVFFFYKEKSYREQKIRQISKASSDSKDYSTNIDRLLRSGVLVRFGEVPQRKGTAYTAMAWDDGGMDGFYVISGKPRYTAQESISTFFPYGYVSHISAMEWYGLTDKVPKVVRFTTCSKVEWKGRFESEFVTRFGSNKEFKDFVPKYPKAGLFFEGKELLVSSETNYVEPASVRGTPMRVSTIGKTFIDMFRHPSFCGGDEHVYDVFLEHGKKYSKQIIADLEKYGRKIDKARLGFMLDKVLGVKHEKISIWREEARHERGGSKVLSTDRPFSSVYDEDWSISLNMEVVKSYGSEN